MKAMVFWLLFLLLSAGFLCPLSLHSQSSAPASKLSFTRHDLTVGDQLTPQSNPDLSGLPAAARSVISATLSQETSSYQARVSGSVFEENPQHKLAVEFTPHGVDVRSGTARCRLALRGYGYGDALRLVSTAAPEIRADGVEYRRGVVTEWYVNGLVGLEQGFTLSEPPGKTRGQPLTIAIALSGDLTPSVDQGGKSLTMTEVDGHERLRYTGLIAYDATGRELQAWLELRGDLLLVEVEDVGARYPLVVDPFVQQAKLTASDGAAVDFFGSSVAISGDGRTVVVGMRRSFGGATYVFVEPASGWATTSTFTAKLTDPDGAASDNFGASVGISGDGRTVVVGSPFATIGINSGQGAAYVFVEPTNGWATTSTFTAKLTASDGRTSDEFGASVGLSIDGRTVVAGSPFADIGSNTAQGSAYVFVEPVSGWTTTSTFTAKLTASDGLGGNALGDSFDGHGGSTIVVGALHFTGFPSPTGGAAYVFVEPASGWAGSLIETAKLTASDVTAGFDKFGNSVGISGDTVVVGAFGSNPQGAAYVFVEPASGWAGSLTETAKLTASDGSAGDNFGMSVGLSGTTVVIGSPVATIGSNVGQGVAYVFAPPASGWATTSTFTAKLTASDGAAGDDFGVSVGISGTTVVVGSDATVGSNVFQGAAYILTNTSAVGQPAISVSPSNIDFVVLSGTTSTVNNISISNPGTATLTISSITTDAPFALVGSLPTAIPAGGQNRFGVVFSPAQAGTFAGTVTIVSNALTSATVITLQGTALSSSFSQLVDPVPALLSGATIKTDQDLLVTGGTPVVGIAADGVARLVIRIPANQVGERFSFTLINDRSGQSQSTDDDGALERVGGSALQSVVLVSGLSTIDGPATFAIYHAPIDFARPAGTDARLVRRSLFIEVRSLDTPDYAFNVPIEILRPPVILIHGLWSGPSAWNFFDPLWCGQFTPTCPDSRFRVFLADYSSTNGGGFVQNASRIQAQILEFTNSFKLQTNSAAVQVDVVAHSMGGDIVRAAVLSPIYLRNSNFRQGIIHKLITIDTPHLGSEFATILLKSDRPCKAFFERVLGLSVRDAIKDLAVGSTMLDSLQQQIFGIRAHMIVGISNAAQTFVADNDLGTLAVQTSCPQLLPPGGFREVFREEPNDLIVRQTSQEAYGLDFTNQHLPTPLSAKTIVPLAVVHTVERGLFDLGPDVLSRDFDALFQLVGVNTGIPQVVIDLLNTPIGQDSFERIRP